MSEHDYSGLDERKGRWWGFWGGVLLIGGSLFVLALFAVVLKLVFGVGD